MYNEYYEPGETDYDSEDADAEAFNDIGEARRIRPIKTAPRQSAFTPRATSSPSYVTQVQLQTALARVSQQIGVNSTAIKTLDGRVRGTAAEQGRLGAGLRKETADRKKESDTLRRNLESTRELSALLPLVAKSGTTLGNLAPLAFLLPPDVLGGATGGSSSGSSSGILGGGSSVVALIAIAAATGAFNSK